MKRRQRTILGAVFFAFLLSSPALQAENFQFGTLLIEDAWARPTGRTGGLAAVYLTLTNQAETDDKIITVSSTASDVAEIHTMTMHGGVMRMRALRELSLPAGESTVLEPKGDHIMLIGLLTPLKEGDNIEVMLELEQLGEITLQVPVARQAPN